MTTNSSWIATSNPPTFPAIEEDITVDVAVIGGGNTGVTAAYLMKKAGLKVALIERDRVGAADTAHTSAHLTCVTDLRLSELVSKFGQDHAQAIWDAGEAAIQQIEQIVADEGIDCDFARVPGFLHAALQEERDESKELLEDARLAETLGFPATYVESVPVFNRPGIQFSNQARFHPLRYLDALVQRIPGDGSHVFEHTEATEFSSDSLSFQANGKTVSCRFIVIATDVPLMGKTGLIDATLFQTKISPYVSYVIGAKISHGAVPDALFWDTSDPYYYFRSERRAKYDYAVFGGLDHKTGQDSDPKAHFAQLEELLKKYFPEANVNHRWSGQVIESVDGLPFIGETVPGQFVATGFSGNGLTYGTLAAMMARDAVQGKENPWRDLFTIRRKKLSSIFNYIKENIDYPYYMIKDRLTGAEGTSLRDVKRREGKILKIDGKRVAVYRDGNGQVTQLSPYCTHMGCLVNWNGAEQAWDCPCHGSRFQATGEVLAGPAEACLGCVKAPSEAGSNAEVAGPVS